MMVLPISLAAMAVRPASLSADARQSPNADRLFLAVTKLGFCIRIPLTSSYYSVGIYAVQQLVSH
jgi:hypothetical protein